MKYRIIADSSCDLTNDYYKDDDIDFKVAPLTIHVKDEEFVDNESIDVDRMLKAMHSFNGKSTTSCPAPGEFLNLFDDDVPYKFCVTISGKMSGTFNCANFAKNQVDSKVHVIDSKGTAGSLVLIINELIRLIKLNLPYEEICTKIDEFRDNSTLLFILSDFDNMVKNGRMSKFTSFVATTLKIKPLCIADDGDIKIKEKIRTMKACLKRLVETIGEFGSDFSQKECIISHCKNDEDAIFLKNAICEKYNFKNVSIMPMRGLCSFYALEKGITVAFG